MAWSEVTTKIANPARGSKKRKRNMAKRHLSAKQIRAGFGGKRRKTALRKRHVPAKHRAASRPKKKSFKKSSHRPRTAKNPVPAIIALELGNPAKRRKQTMAKHRTKKRASAKHRNAGLPRSAKRSMTHQRRTRNPAGLGRPIDWVWGGVGVLGGVVGTRAIPQIALQAKNTGVMGYAANAVTAAGLGWVAHLLIKKPVVTAAVIAGGFAALIARIIGDQTPYGQYLSLPGQGMGDYITWPFLVPQRVTGGGSALEQWSGGAPAGIPAGGMDSAAVC